jgi:protein involved in polysaccharide export with SLBB domain
MAQLTDIIPSVRTLRQRRSAAIAGLATAVCFLLSGCAAVTNPLVEGIPVRNVPDELLAKPRDDAHTIPLDLLGQPRQDVYRLEPEDVLGIWIEGVLQDSSKDRPAVAQVYVAPQLQQLQQRRLPPTIGYPIPVRNDGTIRLPLIDPIKVQGLSVAETEDTIRNIYIKNKLLPEGRDRIVVTLMYPRQIHVVVLRQESGNITLGPGGGLAGGKRNTGHVLNLPATENDVLHAIAETGGLPGLDDYNEIIVFRNSFGSDHDRAILLEKLRAAPHAGNPCAALGSGAQAVRIPLRVHPGQTLPFGPNDVLLRNGDVVFLEARDKDLFYTGGLLPSGQFILPRDYDLDVLKAITRVQGPLVNGGFATNNLSGTLIQPGLGAPSPSLLTVLRQAPDGSQVPIFVDLNRAMRDARERILVRPGDVLILQEKPSEALTRYVSQTFFNFNVVWAAFRSSNSVGVLNAGAPSGLAPPVLNLTQP